MLQRKISMLKKKVFHSIPIFNDKNKHLSLSNRSILKYNNLRYVSSGIPLASIVALLLLGITIINPVSSDVSFALGYEKVQDSNDDKDEKEVKTEADGVKGDEALNEIKENDPSNAALVSANDEIMPLADTMPTSSLTITPGSGGNGGGMNDVVVITPGTTAYRSHNVAVSVKDATNYVLQINSTTNSQELKLEGGNFTLNGASGQTGATLADYTWGYAWGNTGDIDANMNYYALPVAGTTGSGVSTGRLEAGSGSSVNFTKKLVFGAKFGTNALVGHYKASAVLSLAAAPLGVTKLSEMTHMQQMTSEICTNSSIGDKKDEVIDIRDTNTSYSIAKLDDGKCWMTQNLRLVNKVITSSDSDVSSNFTVPASSSLWSNSTTDSAGKSGATVQLVHYANDTTNGAYYSWCEATAGSCADNGTAQQSICPKGWKLPTNGEYDTLLSKAGISSLGTAAAKLAKITGSPYNFVKAGYIDNSKFNGVGINGKYWTSVAAGSSFTTNAYMLTFNSSWVETANGGTKNNGLSIRCIAR